MTSRRKFIQTSSALLGSLAPVSAATRPVHVEPVHVKEDPHSGDRDFWNDLPNYMIRKVNAARDQRKAELTALRTKAQADVRLASIRERTWELIGGKPESTPLNPKITGVIERTAYRIEKVIFESQPAYYVTAHLYLPKGVSGPFPAILAPVGHANEGKTFSSYQTLFQNLARQGFAVFAFEPPGQGERLQYIDPVTRQSLFGSTGEHDRFGIPALLIGSSTTQFEAWDGIRALDYLLSRSEIDASRIGCCGHSGGGTQTMFLCALEPRIQVAVEVEGHSENLAGANYQPPGAYADAEQNLIGGLQVPLDRGDLLAAFAPKPLLMCYTPIDTGTTYSPTYVEGTREIAAELKQLYALYGAAEKASIFASPLPHDYDYFHRRATYQWFNKWLTNGREVPEEVVFDDAPAASLWCTPTGQVLTSFGGRSAWEVNRDRLKNIKQDAGDLKYSLKSVLALPLGTSVLQGKTISNNVRRDIVIQEIQFISEPGIRIPGWFIKPSSGSSKLPVAILTSDQSKDWIFDEWRMFEEAVHAGIAICSVDLRTGGVTRPRFPSSGPAFYGDGIDFAYSMVNLTMGTPIPGQQTWDLLRCLDYLSSRSDVDTRKIGLCTTAATGLSAVAATVLDDRICSLLLNRTLAGFASVVSSKEYTLPLSAVTFGLLKKFDLPDLCAKIAPRPLWLSNMVGAQGEPLSVSQVQAAYSKANQARVSVEPGKLDGVFGEWTKKTLL